MFQIDFKEQSELESLSIESNDLLLVTTARQKIDETVQNAAAKTVEGRSIERIFQKADWDGNGYLDDKELLHFFRLLNLELTQKSLRKFITKRPTFSTIRAVYNDLLSTSVRKIFDDHCGGKEALSISDFSTFLTSTQQETQTSKHVQEIFNKFGRAVAPNEAENETMDIYGFYEYMRTCNILNPELKTTVNQDMTRPMTDYWISSSHNTYLEGAQVRFYYYYCLIFGRIIG